MESVKQYFKDYPTADKVHQTSDGFLFSDQNYNDALNHAKTLPGKSVKNHNREDYEENVNAKSLRSGALRSDAVQVDEISEAGKSGAMAALRLKSMLTELVKPASELKPAATEVKDPAKTAVKEKVTAKPTKPKPAVKVKPAEKPVKAAEKVEEKQAVEKDAAGGTSAEGESSEDQTKEN